MHDWAFVHTDRHTVPLFLQNSAFLPASSSVSYNCPSATSSTFLSSAPSLPRQRRDPRKHVSSSTFEQKKLYILMNTEKNDVVDKNLKTTLAARKQHHQQQQPRKKGPQRGMVSVGLSKSLLSGESGVKVDPNSFSLRFVKQGGQVIIPKRFHRVKYQTQDENGQQVHVDDLEGQVLESFKESDYWKPFEEKQLSDSQQDNNIKVNDIKINPEDHDHDHQAQGIDHHSNMSQRESIKKTFSSAYSNQGSTTVLLSNSNISGSSTSQAPSTYSQLLEENQKADMLFSKSPENYFSVEPQGQKSMDKQHQSTLQTKQLASEELDATQIDDGQEKYDQDNQEDIWDEVGWEVDDGDFSDDDDSDYDDDPPAEEEWEFSDDEYLFTVDKESRTAKRLLRGFGDEDAATGVVISKRAKRNYRANPDSTGPNFSINTNMSDDSLTESDDEIIPINDDNLGINIEDASDASDFSAEEDDEEGDEDEVDLEEEDAFIQTRRSSRYNKEDPNKNQNERYNLAYYSSTQFKGPSLQRYSVMKNIKNTVLDCWDVENVYEKEEASSIFKHTDKRMEVPLFYHPTREVVEIPGERERLKSFLRSKKEIQIKLPILYIPSNSKEKIPKKLVNLMQIKAKTRRAPALRFGKDTQTWKAGLECYIKPVISSQRCMCYVIRKNAGMIARLDTSKETLLPLTSYYFKHMKEDAFCYVAGMLTAKKCREEGITEVFIDEYTKKRGGNVNRLAIFLSSCAAHGLRVRFNFTEFQRKMDVLVCNRYENYPALINMTMNNVEVWEFLDRDFEWIRKYFKIEDPNRIKTLKEIRKEAWDRRQRAEQQEKKPVAMAAAKREHDRKKRELEAAKQPRMY